MYTNLGWVDFFSVIYKNEKVHGYFMWFYDWVVNTLSYNIKHIRKKAT